MTSSRLPSTTESSLVYECGFRRLMQSNRGQSFWMSPQQAVLVTNLVATRSPCPGSG